jgi:hypothetical protein
MARIVGSRRVCIPSGYRYEYNGPKTKNQSLVLHSRTERWDTEVGKTVCGREIGDKVIDGALTSVVRVGGKFYAATIQSVRRPRPRRR